MLREVEFDRRVRVLLCPDLYPAEAPLAVEGGGIICLPLGTGGIGLLLAMAEAPADVDFEAAASF